MGLGVLDFGFWIWFGFGLGVAKDRTMVITMAKLRMVHAITHGARKPPGPMFSGQTNFFLVMVELGFDNNNNNVMLGDSCKGYMR